MEVASSSSLIPLLVAAALLLVFGAVAAFVVYAALRGKREREALVGRKARARPGRARVLSATTKQTTSGNQVVTDVYLTLEIETPSGPVVGKAVWTVDPLHMDKLREGSSVDVLVDADVPQRVYPAVAWVSQSGMDPNRWMQR